MELGKSSNLQKRIRNLVNKLRVDENSLLFGKSNETSSKLEKNLKDSKYEKDKVFSELMTNLKKSGKKLEIETVINTSY